MLTGAVARAVHCHPATVRRAIETGQLDAYRLGERGAWRVTPDAIRRWQRSAHSEESA